jgi:hypothetical protein
VLRRAGIGAIARLQPLLSQISHDREYKSAFQYGFVLTIMTGNENEGAGRGARRACRGAGRPTRDSCHISAETLLATTAVDYCLPGQCHHPGHAGFWGIAGTSVFADEAVQSRVFLRGSCCFGPLLRTGHRAQSGMLCSSGLLRGGKTVTRTG